MILQSSITSQIDNVVTLIGTKNIHSARSLNSLAAVQIAFRAFIELLQQRTIAGIPGTVNIISDPKKAHDMRPLFFSEPPNMSQQRQPDSDAKEVRFAREKADLVRRALDEMAALCPQHAALFNTMITDIFIMPSTIAASGSNSRAIGVIWVNPSIDYSVHDVIELLLHELTHHTMYLDELRYGHYNYQAINNDWTWAKSAIHTMSSPLNEVMHSVVASMEILLLREHHLGHPCRPKVHPPTARMLVQIHDAIASMDAILFNESPVRSKLFRPRVMEILHQVKQQLRVHDYDDSTIPITCRTMHASHYSLAF